MKPLIVANWKCNPNSFKKADNILSRISEKIKEYKKVSVVICPPFVFIPMVLSKAKYFEVGAQNIFWGKEGAYTGEVTSSMIKSIDCKYAIVGHSERREYFNETNKIVGDKIKEAVNNKINVIFCFGETKEEKEKGDTIKFITSQIKESLRGIKESDLNNIIFAYEPIWAIGTGVSCKREDVEKVVVEVKKIIRQKYSKFALEKIKILYGGSVNSKNAEKYLKGGIGGLLVGGASLSPLEFDNILKIANEIK